MRRVDDRLRVASEPGTGRAELQVSQRGERRAARPHEELVESGEGKAESQACPQDEDATILGFHCYSLHLSLPVGSPLVALGSDRLESMD